MPARIRGPVGGDHQSRPPQGWGPRRPSAGAEVNEEAQHHRAFRYGEQNQEPCPGAAKRRPQLDDRTPGWTAERPTPAAGPSQTASAKAITAVKTEDQPHGPKIVGEKSPPETAGVVPIGDRSQQVGNDRMPEP